MTSPTTHRVLVLALAASLAFNLGFLSSRILGADAVPEVDEPSAESAAYPDEFYQLCDRLESDLEGLRAIQAEHTRELADLMASDSPDRAAIEACLDCLSTTERKIKGALVETVLAQRDLLPPDQRSTFCSTVRDRLCTPWEGCAPATGCASHECTKDQRGQDSAHGGTHDS